MSLFFFFYFQFLVHDKKPIIIISPNVNVQTESSRLTAKTHTDVRKKSLIDSGIELLFKKHINKNPKDTNSTYHLHQTIDTQQTGQRFNQKDHNIIDQPSDKKRIIFDNIKIYTDKRRKNQLETGPSKVISTGVEVITDDEYIDTTQIPVYNLCQDSPQLDEHGSPIKKQKRILSGHKQMDKIIHTMIDYIIRDYIESWFCSLSDNKEFSEFRTRSSIEECLQNICKR